jgi:DNA-binding CsgD family transcriptional regulator
VRRTGDARAKPHIGGALPLPAESRPSNPTVPLIRLMCDCRRRMVGTSVEMRALRRWYLYGRYMRSVRVRVSVWLPFAASAVFLTAWWFCAGRVVDVVPLRTETFDTNPYGVLIAIGIGIAIALARVTAPTSLVLVTLLLALQLLFWPTRFSQVSWVAYLGLLAVSAGLFASSRSRVRLVALVAACVWAIAAAALLTLPSLSLSGMWGTINGKTVESPEVLQGFAIWSVVGLLATSYLWFLSHRSRARRADRTNSTSAATDADAPAPHSDRSASLGRLSSREQDIFRLVVQGMSNAEVARSAHIEESTVKTHLTSILSKLGLSSRVQLVVYAYEHGLRGPLETRSPAESLTPGDML